MSSQASEASDRSKSFFCHSCSNSFLKHPEAVSSKIVITKEFSNRAIFFVILLYSGVRLSIMSTWLHRGAPRKCGIKSTDRR